MIMGITFWDASLNLTANMGGAPGYDYAVRARATVAWVIASCEAEMLPQWCIALVVERVKRALLERDFPLVEMAIMGGNDNG
jgi:hypothetical protein